MKRFLKAVFILVAVPTTNLLVPGDYQQIGEDRRTVSATGPRVLLQGWRPKQVAIEELESRLGVKVSEFVVVPDDHEFLKAEILWVPRADDLSHWSKKWMEHNISDLRTPGAKEPSSFKAQLVGNVVYSNKDDGGSLSVLLTRSDVQTCGFSYYLFYLDRGAFFPEASVESSQGFMGIQRKSIYREAKQAWIVERYSKFGDKLERRSGGVTATGSTCVKLHLMIRPFFSASADMCSLDLPEVP